MLYDAITELYKRFRLMQYRSLFRRIGGRKGSLSATEAYSVDVIYLLGRPSIKQFSEFLGISQPNATYKISSLVKKGYIVREQSEDDRRETRLGVAEKFYAYYDLNNGFIRDALAKLESEYSPDELALFGRMSASLAQAVE